MSQICTCDDPYVITPKTGDKYCKRCGHFWDRKHGSKYPRPPAARDLLPTSLQEARFVGVARTEKRAFSRNSKCPCGSGKRFKRCCEAKVK